MKATIVLPDTAIVAGGVGWDAVQLIGRAWCGDAGEGWEALVRPVGRMASWAHYADTDDGTLFVRSWPDWSKHGTVYEINASEGLVPAARVLQSALMFAAAGPTFAEQAAGARALIAASGALEKAPRLASREWDDRGLEEAYAIARALHHLWNGLRAEAWDFGFLHMVAAYAETCERRAREARGSEYVALMNWQPQVPAIPDPSEWGPAFRTVRLRP